MAVGNGLARWNGVSLEPVSGAPPGNGINGYLFDFDSRAGAFGGKLFVGGNFSTAGDLATTCIAAFDGQVWSDLSGGIDLPLAVPQVQKLAVFEGDNGDEVWAAGLFGQAGANDDVNGFAKWDGASWTEPAALAPEASIIGLEATNLDGVAAGLDGPRLWLGGDFNSVDGLPDTLRIAGWDGTEFSALGTGTNNTVRAFAPFDDGNGVDLYVGGSFSMAGGVTVNRIARWDGAACRRWAPPASIKRSVVCTCTTTAAARLSLPPAPSPPPTARRSPASPAGTQSNGLDWAASISPPAASTPSRPSTTAKVRNWRSAANSPGRSDPVPTRW